MASLTKIDFFRMNPCAQRIKIAEVCGWTEIRLSQRWEVTNGPDDPIVLCGINPAVKLREEIPDYLNDLNKMHDAESVLSDKQQERFDFELGRIVGARIGSPSFMTTHATAAQRAEAFLKALNLWEEETK